MPVTPPSTSLAWALLVVAGLLEVAWAIGLKHTHGFTRPLASALTLLAMGASFALLAQALRAIPVGTGYAVWTGIGAAGAAVLGIVLLGEPRNAGRLACLALIVVGIVGLKLFTPDAPGPPDAENEAAAREVPRVRPPGSE